MIESHSEQKIVECCIDLMQELVNEFEKYIDYIDIDLTELPLIPSLNKKTLTTQEQICSCVVFFYWHICKK